jgi:hypothetical protein
MRREVALAARREAVRRAAAAWRGAGTIDATAEETIARLYPDDRVRIGPALRVLLFVFTLIAFESLFGLASTIIGFDRSLWLLPLPAAVLLAVATEVATGRLRLAGFGIESALALLAVGNFAGACLALLARTSLPPQTTITFTVALTGLAAAAAAWRWGGPHFALGAAGALFFVLARLPGARPFWIAAAAALLPLLHAATRSARWAPPHRRAAAAGLLVALAALYLAVHLGSFDARLVEELALEGENKARLLPRALAIAGTALVPALVLAWGLYRRDRLLLAAGFVMLVASVVTFCVDTRPGPTGLLLTAGGAALVALALGLRRWLDAGASGERFGFTAAPAHDADAAGARTLEVAAVLATVAPAAAAPAQPRFAGRGGEMGGGGASSDF